MKRNICLFICLLGFLPIPVFAYSDKVILGGESIGIQIETPGVMVIGFYKVNGDYIKGIPEIKPGDLIVKVNDQNISTISDLTSQIEKNIEKEITLTVKREDRDPTLSLFHAKAIKCRAPEKLGMSKLICACPLSAFITLLSRAITL